MVATVIAGNSSAVTVIDWLFVASCSELHPQTSQTTTQQINPARSAATFRIWKLQISLFREFVAQLVKYEKKFLIIGNVNAVKYKEIFPLIKAGKLWLGCSSHSGDREFGVPEDYPLEAASCRLDEHGKKYIRVKGVRWFTNLDYRERHEDMILSRKYDPELYPKYENYDAIEVGKTADIPCDYDGVMGVPLTLMDKFNPLQFELIGIAEGDSGKALGLRPYDRALKKLNPSLRDGQLYYIKDGKPIKPFDRILIRRRHKRRSN